MASSPEMADRYGRSLIAVPIAVGTRWQGIAKRTKDRILTFDETGRQRVIDLPAHASKQIICTLGCQLAV
jgi:hypothetical protein